MTVFGDVPRPRVLFEDVPNEIFQTMKDLAPTHEQVVVGETKHDSDWDILVTFAEAVTERSESLHVLSFGSGLLRSEYTQVGYLSPPTYLSRRYPSGSRACRVREATPKAVRRLLTSAVVPHIDVHSHKGVWESGYVPLDANSVEPEMIPWLTLGAEESVYAFEWTPAYGRGLWWVLPGETTSHRDWLALMLKRLQELDPDAVPADPDWRRQPEWAPSRLLRALTALEHVEDEREAAAIEFDRRESEANSLIDTELSSAAESEHILLTGTGDPLAEQAARAFEMIGFDVEDMDEHHVNKSGARLEDLRLTLPGVTDWVCLVEVKGWTGGLQVRDVSQIVGRPAIQFVLDAQREPEKVLLVVNQHRNDPPSTRPVPPVKAPDRDLAPLEQFDGAFIDTRDLFKAVQAIASGDVQPEVVRDSIVKATGVWSWPVVTPVADS